MEEKFRLRLMSFNCWHGLDHNSPLMMLPLETFLQNWRRQAALIRGLRSYLLPATYLKNSDVKCLEVFNLQEINPNTKLTKKISRALKVL